MVTLSNKKRKKNSKRNKQIKKTNNINIKNKVNNSNDNKRTNINAKKTINRIDEKQSSIEIKLNNKQNKDLTIQSQSILNTKKQKNKIFNKVINIISLIIKILFFWSFILNLFILIKTDILPFKYLSIFILISSIVLIFAILTEFILKNKILKIISIIFSLMFIALYIFTYKYISKTDKFINGLFGNEQIEKYYVAVLNDSNYEDINDLENFKIGTYYHNEDSYKSAFKSINELINFEEVKYDNLFKICEALSNQEIDAILISDGNKNIIEEINELDHIKLKYIYDFSIKSKLNIESKDIDVTKNPFIVYITGIDTYNDISNVSRSDVNIIVTVNPKTKEILLVTIPRDYYVQLHGTTGIRDKLTHAGLYGVDMSVSTIEDLLDLDINYYIRLNFSTLINAIDAIGGIDIYSEFDFNTYGYQFYQGYNHVNGEYALAFSRERKSIGGDRIRGQNQMRVIEAIINKISTSRVLVNNYLGILKSLEGTFQTNIEVNRIYDLVKMQLASMPKWKIYTYSLDGYDSQDYTYSMDIMTFVMEPDYNTVDEAKTKIKELLEKN